MNKIVLALAAALLSVSCTPEPPVAGGWSSVSRDDPNVAAAEAVALDAIYTQHPTRALVDRVSGESQVVAGMNYRFRVEMSGSPAARDIFEVVVYQDLDGNLSVTSLDQLQGE